MTEHSHERIAQLLALLSPPPPGWAEAARELPRARELMDGIVGRAAADAAYREEVVGNLEAALAQGGVEPVAPLVEHLRHRLTAD